MNPFTILRTLIFPWAFAALLPIPMLLAVTPARHAEIKCLYLGLASAWLATEIFGFNGLPASRSAWTSKLIALLVALTVNVSLFVLLGISVGVRSNIPWALMAIFAAVPAIGFIPWLLQRIKQPFAAIILGATLVATAKLAGCIVARVVYGPDYLEQGYAAGNWHTAKLMISIFWAITIVASLVLLLLSYRSTAPDSVSSTT